MNCNDFLPALETGGFARRMRARRHAAQCPRCAAVRAAFTATKQQLAAAEPLSPRARQLWQRAAGEVTLRPSRRRVWIPAAAGLGVAACILLLVVDLTVRKESVAPQLAPAVTRLLTPALPMTTRRPTGAGIFRENNGTSRALSTQPSKIPEPLNTTTVDEVDPAEGLSRLAAAVERLDADLQRLRHEAERLHARQQVAVTLDRFDRW